MYGRFAMYERGRGSGGGRGRGGQEPPSAEDAQAWFSGRLPDDWFTGGADVSVDREEIIVLGELAEPEGDYADDAARAAAKSGRIDRFREQTREERIEIARQAEHRYGRKVAWGARIGEHTELFTTLAAPVMTRLRQPERKVLDTLVDAGVARSRSEALGWAVRLVGEHTDEWLSELREALAKVDELRNEGPNPT